ncbi:major facilitator superfamily domain-containing protein 10 isoform X2 [Lepus europaeus]|uniref:major facilitator superfamily domain-containing protein 10 isoform X2 n=1 Tax=Lepus europaeus TaxID=9983 RepID=UPI002B46102C|nr:major facilitator superfamily domain-containing protein 10 isoform X2 [Lepus europaeus]
MGWGGDEGCTPRPPIRPQPASTRRVLAVVFVGLLLDLLAFTLLLPLLPRLLESHGRAHDPLYGAWQRGVDWFAAAIGMPAEKRYHGVLFGGVIGSAFSVLQFLSAPLTGAASDCLGRRPLMLLSLAGVATSYAVWAGSRSFAAFLASRVVGGASKGNVSLSTAIVADLGSPRARSQGMAVIGVAFSLAFTLGPLLGACLPMTTAPWLGLLLALVDLLFLFCFLPETLPPEKRAPSIALGFRAAADLLSPLALLRFSAVARGGEEPPKLGPAAGLDTLRRLGLVYFLYLFLFSGLEFTLSFLVHQRFQFSSRGRRGALPVLCGGRLWLASTEGHGHGHTAEPGRPGQGSGTPGGGLSVLAGRGPGLLLRLLGPLPAARRAPVQAEPPGAAQGRVAEPRSRSLDGTPTRPCTHHVRPGVAPHRASACCPRHHLELLGADQETVKNLFVSKTCYMKDGRTGPCPSTQLYLLYLVL